MGKITSKKLSSRKIRLNANSSLGVPINPQLIPLLENEELAVPDQSSAGSGSSPPPAILKKLEASNVNDRVWAVASVGQLLSSSNTSTVKLLLKHNAIELLIKAFRDPSREAVQEATGVLRNLINHQLFTVSNQHSIQTPSLFDLRGIFDSLFANIAYVLNKLEPALKQCTEQMSQIQTGGQPTSTQTREDKLNLSEQKLIFDIYQNLFLIVQSICENSRMGIGYANNLGILPTIEYIAKNSSYFASPLVQASLQCLYTMSEFNPSLEATLLNDPALEITNALLSLLGNSEIASYESIIFKNTSSPKQTEAVAGAGEQANAKNILYIRILSGATLSNLQKSRFFINNSNSNANTNTKPTKWDETLVNRVLLEAIAAFITVDLTSDVNSTVAVFNQLSNARSQQPSFTSENNENDVDGFVALCHSKLEAILGDTSKIQLTLELAANIFSEEDLEISEFDGRNGTTKSKNTKHGKSDTNDEDEDGGDDDEWMDQDSDDDSGSENDSDGNGDTGDGDSNDAEMNDQNSDDGITDNTGKKNKKCKTSIDEDFDEVDMIETLGNESTFAVSVWEEAEPVIKVFLNKVIPALFTLMAPPMGLTELLIKTTTSSNSNSGLSPGDAGHAAARAASEAVAADIEMLSAVTNAFLIINSTSFACFNNFLSVIEQFAVDTTRKSNPSSKAPSKKSASDSIANSAKENSDGMGAVLSTELALWWNQILQSVGVCYTTLQSINALSSSSSNTNSAAFDLQQALFLDWADVLERGISCLWTIARTVLPSNFSSIPIDENTINGLITICNLTNIPASSRTATVGLLGKISQVRPGHIDNNRKINSFLLELVASCLSSFSFLISSASKGNAAPAVLTPAKPDSLLPAIQALDDMFDTYSDMTFDYDAPVFVGCGYLASLTQILALLKTTTKSIDKRKFKRMRSQADLAVTNLTAFIKYKKNERN